MPTAHRNQHRLQQLIAALPTRAEIEQTAIAIQQIPAPTFDERERSDEVRRRFTALGLKQVDQDEHGNVYGCYQGSGQRTGLLIAAHLDTVFQRSTDLAVRQDGDLIHGPGIGDNSLGVAGLVHLAAMLTQAAPVLAGDVWFVADVCEEGLGNLRGMRAALDRLDGQIGTVIALEGAGFGRIYHHAIGVTRLRIETHAPGGHSWADHGAPSAIDLLLRIGASLTEVTLPSQPRSTLNIGVIQGGTSINVIAEDAWMLLDLRSMDQETLDRLVGDVKTAIKAVPCPDGTMVKVTTVGQRDAGTIATDHPLATAAAEALRAVGAEVVWGSGSTDANVPLSRGIPAVCIGITQGSHAHRLDEYIDGSDIPRGMEALLRLVWSISAPPDT